MNNTFDEIDHSTPAATATNNPSTINSTLTTTTNNNVNNNVIQHPLSTTVNQNDDFEDGMMEINLKLDNENNVKNLTTTTTDTKTIPNMDNITKLPTTSTTNASQKTTTKASPEKSNWVKFDEENSNGGIQQQPIENLNINRNNLNNINNNLTNNNNSTSLMNSSIQTTSTTAPPPINLTSNKVQQPKSLQQSMQVNKNVSTVPSSSASSGAAVLTTESTHVNIDRMNSSSVNNQNNHDGNSNNSKMHANNTPKNVSITIPTSSPIRTVELSTGRVREGFANGDVIVNLLPTNTKWPWLTPAVFRPELVPEELMAQGLTLTVEEYVAAMETLVNDYRFTLYNICYKRVLVCWIAFAFCVLLVLLFSGLQGIALFSLGVAWLFLNATAIFACMWMKLRLSRGLEKCMGRVNKQLLRHKILLVLDDRGRISCHKVNLCFMYFDPAQCIAFLNEFIERQEQLGNSIQAGWEKKLDLDVSDIVIQGSNPVRLSRKQEMAALLYLRYASRWGNDVLRGLVDVSITEPSRHCASYMCPCQFIERHLSCKPRGYPCSCCFYMSDPSSQYRY